MFKDKLKELRKQKGLTQEDLADILHISRSAVAKWEQGLGVPNKDSLNDIINYFEITKEELFIIDDSLEVIDKINEVHSKSKKRVIMIFLLISILMVGTLVPIIIVSNKNVTKYYDSFFTDKYLKEVGLNDLSISNEYEISRVNDDTIYLNFSDKDDFDEYANNLFDVVNSSPYISRVCFSLTAPTNLINDNNDNQLLVESENLSYYKNESLNSLSGSINNTVVSKKSSYTIFYLKDLESNRVKKEPIDVYKITLSYDEMFFDLNNNDIVNQYNTCISIKKIEDSKNNTVHYYLLDEFYGNEMVYVNNDNYLDYYSTRNTQVKGVSFITHIKPLNDSYINLLAYQVKVILVDYNTGTEYSIIKKDVVDYSFQTDGSHIYFCDEFGLENYENVGLKSIEYIIKEPSFIFKLKK